MGGGDYIAPTPPSYGESLEEALKAQTDLLRGTGEFKGTGGLQALVEQYEAPLRRSTAQIDTDVLRQTLVGNQTEEVSGTYDDQGRLVIGQTQKSAGQEPILELNEISPRKYQNLTKRWFN